MEFRAGVKSITGQATPRRNFTRWKEKPFRTQNYLEFLAHYDAGLVQIDGPIVIVGHKTGTELPLEQKGKLLMVTALINEFGSVSGANKAVENYKASHS